MTPQKGAVDSCSTTSVAFQLNLPKEMAELGSRIEFNTMLTLKGETIEQFKVNFIAEVVK